MDKFKNERKKKGNETFLINSEEAKDVTISKHTEKIEQFSSIN